MNLLARTIMRLVPLTFLLGCSQTAAPSSSAQGAPVRSAPTLAADEAAYSALVSQARTAEMLSAASAAAAYPARFLDKLSYDPTQAAQLSLIQGSALALSDGETAVLKKNGFVISTRRSSGTFLRGLAEIYSEHLPLYVSADTLLEAVHSSYDDMLGQVEGALVIPELRALLQGMRERLAATPVSASVTEQARTDTDLYLAVALSLLDGKPADPVAGAKPGLTSQLVSRAQAAEGVQSLTLFGVERAEDFSQFKPRGHYTTLPMMQQYFRAQMWLGRIDLRIIETDDRGQQFFRRDQYLATLLLYALIGPDQARFDRIENTIRTFVGESDYMVPSQVGKLIGDLGGEVAAATATDDAVVAAIVAGSYGKQQIASHLMGGDDTPGKSLPLNRSFALLGQRYVVDSHVFSEAVYDRVKGRLMVNPLDAAFAALGNNQALALDPDVATVNELPGALARMRVLIDAHPQDFWDASFYNLWLRALRTLSPPADLTASAHADLPEVAKTELWGRRMLNTQLGSWAELRHDTLLYAKQSYAGTPGCEFPDAYVDPYPEFYRALGKYADAGSRMAELVAEVSPNLATRIANYFALLSQATSILADMADRELRGEPFSDEQLAFINQAVRIEKKSAGCTTIDVPDGWYAHLFFDPAKSIELNPTIADVHTQPADEAGNTVGKVLHVGTGSPRLMVTTVDTCMGPRAYAGIVYAYHELITKDFLRLSDEDWAHSYFGQDPSKQAVDVPWLANVLAQ